MKIIGRLLPPADNLFFTGLIEYKRWPEQYFGIGPDSEEDDLKISDYYIITVEQKAYKNLGKQLLPVEMYLLSNWQN